MIEKAGLLIYFILISLLIIAVLISLLMGKIILGGLFSIPLLILLTPIFIGRK